jgi:hypothetical protein
VLERNAFKNSKFFHIQGLKSTTTTGLVIAAPSLLFLTSELHHGPKLELRL